MTKKTDIAIGEQQKQLYEWAEEQLFSDDVQRFLRDCKDKGKEATEVVSYTDFLVLKEEFEA